MKPTDTMTAAEYMRLVETANKRRADTHRKGHPEHDLQVACVAWFRAQYPKDAAMLFAVPNGGHRNAIEAARMKTEGVTPGVAAAKYVLNNMDPEHWKEKQDTSVSLDVNTEQPPVIVFGTPESQEPDEAKEEQP